MQWSQRMLAGVATRRHVAEEVGVEDTAMSRSAVSRRFKAATEEALAQTGGPRPQRVGSGGADGRRGGVADQMVVVALVITAD